MQNSQEIHSVNHPVLRVVLVMLFTCMGMAEDSTRPVSEFTRVQPGHWAYDALKTLKESGVFESRDWVATDRRLNRYEMAALVYEAVLKEQTGFEFQNEEKRALNRLQEEFARRSSILQKQSQINEQAIFALKSEVSEEDPGLQFMGWAMFSAIHRDHPGSQSQMQVDGLKLGIERQMEASTRMFAVLNVNTDQALDVSLEEAFYLEFENQRSHVRLGRQWLPFSMQDFGPLHINPQFVSHSFVETRHSGVLQGLVYQLNLDEHRFAGIGWHDGVLRTTPDPIEGHWLLQRLQLSGLQTSDVGFVNDFQESDLRDGGGLFFIGSEDEESLFDWKASYYQTRDTIQTSTLANQVAGRLQTRFMNLGLSMRPATYLELSAEFVDGRTQNYVRSDRFDAVGRMDHRGFFAGSPSMGRVVEDDFKTLSVQAIMNLDDLSSVGLRYGAHEVIREGQRSGLGTANAGFDDQAEEVTVSVRRKVGDSSTLILEYSRLDLAAAQGLKPQKTLPKNGQQTDLQNTIRASYRIEF